MGKQSFAKFLFVSLHATRTHYTMLSCEGYAIRNRTEASNLQSHQICFPWKCLNSAPTWCRARNSKTRNKIIYSCNWQRSCKCATHAMWHCANDGSVTAAVTRDIDLNCIVHILSVHKWFPKGEWELRIYCLLSAHCRMVHHSPLKCMRPAARLLLANLMRNHF